MLFSTIIVVLLVLLVAVKIYFKITAGWDKSYTCLLEKTAIVTGANTGIGYVTALEFAKRGGRVILACRNENRAKEAVAKIISETGNENVCFKILDMSSLSSVRSFAEEINATEERLDILVNNAGAAGLLEKITDDGLEISMQINYFSVFLVTNLLIGLMKKSSTSRIVNVSSIAARYADVDPKNFHVSYAGLFMSYSRAKLCTNLFTVELAKKLEGTGVAVFALHPGAIVTDIWRRLGTVFKYILWFFATISFKTIEEGAQTTIHVALAKNLEKLKGGYFEDCRLVEHYDNAKNPKLSREIWVKSEELVKLTPEEKKSRGF